MKKLVWIIIVKLVSMSSNAQDFFHYGDEWMLFNWEEQLKNKPSKIIHTSQGLTKMITDIVEFDSFGNKTAYYHIIGKVTTSKHTYQYNKKRLLKKEVTIDSDGEIFIDSLLSYEKDVANYISYRKLQPETIDTYNLAFDKKLRLVSKSIKASIRKKAIGYFQAYNGKNLVEKKETFLGKINTGKEIYTYDVNNNLSKKEVYSKNRLLYHKEYKRDEYGNIIEEKIVDMEDDTKSETTIFTYTLTLDAFGNWIKKETIENGKTTDTEERIITY